MTLFSAVFLSQEDFQENQVLQTLIIVLTFAANFHFFSLWVLRFSIVLFRVHLVRLRESRYFPFLKYLNINDYDEDLIQNVENIVA
jgi:hypothetical protein